MKIVVPTTVRNNENIVVDNVFTANGEHVSSFPAYSTTAPNQQGAMRVHSGRLYRALEDCVDRQPDLYVDDFWSDEGPWDNATANAWVVGTNYPIGQTVSHALSYKRFIYKAAVANVGIKPSSDNGTTWGNQGAQNLYRCLYDKTNNKTERAGTVWLTVDSSMSDTAAMIGMRGTSCKITQMLEDNTIVMATEYSLLYKGAKSMSEYIFNPFITQESVWQNILKWGKTKVKFEVNYPNGIAAVGRIIVGRSTYIGKALWGGTAGIVDFSVKKRDENFGDVYMQQRDYADRANLKVYVPTKDADLVKKFLTSIRGTEVLFIGDDRDDQDAALEMLSIYGFYKDFDVLLNGPEYTEIQINYEALT